MDHVHLVDGLVQVVCLVYQDRRSLLQNYLLFKIRHKYYYFTYASNFHSNRNRRRKLYAYHLVDCSGSNGMSGIDHCTQPIDIEN